MAVGVVEDLSLGDEIFATLLFAGAQVFDVLETRADKVAVVIKNVRVDWERLKSDVGDENFLNNLLGSLSILWKDVTKWIREFGSLPQSDEDPDESLFQGLHI